MTLGASGKVPSHQSIKAKDTCCGLLLTICVHLISAYFSNSACSPGDVSQARALPHVYDRAAIFYESLGVTPPELEIFGNTNPMATWFELYGYDTAAEAKPELRPRGVALSRGETDAPAIVGTGGSESSSASGRSLQIAVMPSRSRR